MALMRQQAPRGGPHILMQVVGWWHCSSWGVMPTTTTHMMVMIVVLKELIFSGREVVQWLLLQNGP